MWAALTALFVVLLIVVAGVMAYRTLLKELPGYAAADTGELETIS